MTSERGQSTPFFLCFLVLMTVMVGTMVNVGQAINRRMALQILADAGAWTGATNMAIGLNGLAEVNEWRHDIEPVASIGVPVAGFFGADGVMKTIFEVGTTIINFVDMGIQLGYAKIPYDEAARVIRELSTAAGIPENEAARVLDTLISLEWRPGGER